MVKRDRGLTLAELLMVLGIGALLLTSALMIPRGNRAAAGSVGMSQAVSGILEMAREQAMASKEVMAVALPSSAGRVGHAQSLYLLRGDGTPQPLKSWNLAPEFPQTALFAGTTTLSGLTIPGQLTASANGGFHLSQYHPPQPQDPVVVFLPSGGVLASFPLVDGAYRLVLAEGLRAHPVAVSGHATFLLDAVSKAQTISIYPSGLVVREPGLHPVGATAVSDQPLGFSAPAPPLQISTGSNQAPVLTGPVIITPKFVPASLPPGIDALVTQEGHLSLETRARDADGDLLTCRWSARPLTPGQTNPGRFSHPAASQMEWDSAGQERVSRWDWFPPPDSGGQIFELTGQVEDSQGAAVTATLGTSGKVQVSSRTRIAYTLIPANGMADAFIRVCDQDEVSIRDLCPRKGRHQGLPRWSPDGAHLCYMEDNGGSGPGSQMSLWIVDSLGQAPQKLLTEGDLGTGLLLGYCWVPDGANLAVAFYQAGRIQVCTMRLADYTTPGVTPPAPTPVADLPWQGLLPPDPSTWDSMEFNQFIDLQWLSTSDRRFLIFSPNGVDPPGSNLRYAGNLLEVRPDAPGGPQVSVLRSSVVSDFHLNLTGDKLLFQTPADMVCADYSASPGSPGSLSNVVTLATFNVSPMRQPRWAPDGQTIYYCSGGVLHRCNADGSGIEALPNETRVVDADVTR